MPRSGARHLFDPAGEYVARKKLTTSREFLPGERFDNSSVPPRRLRLLFQTRKIIPASEVGTAFGHVGTPGRLTPRPKDGVRRSPGERRERVASEPLAPSETDGEPSEEAIAIDELIGAASVIPWAQFKRRATDILGAESTPAKKAEIITALEAKRDAAAKPPEGGPDGRTT